jgi:uncharacterized protein (TIGR02145 family)
MTRYNALLSLVLISGIILIIQPMRVVNAQEKEKFILGPQLFPIGFKTTEPLSYIPWPQTLLSNCNNSDFSLGDWTNWQGCYGHYGNSCQNQGFQTTGAHPTHKIIPGPGWHDHNTCDSLINVFPGESFVARLGDTIYSGPSYYWMKAAELKYQVSVTSNSYLFIYRYAVVLQTGGHNPPDHQPDFQVMITNVAGTVLDSTCGYYYITAQVSGPPVNGWHRCTWASNGAVYWKDWTTVGMDLTPYMGQTIFVKFKVRACNYDTHFGYAYISTYCNALQIQTALCEGDTSATLTAPPGFSHYLWNTGDTTQSITVPNPTTGQTYSCTITAYNNCTVTISVLLTYTVVYPNFTSTPNCPTLPSVFHDSTTLNQNQVVTWKWYWDDGTPPTTTSDPDPTHIFAQPGTYNVKMIAYSTEGCFDSIIKPVTIDTMPTLTNNPLQMTICSGLNTNLVLTSNCSGTGFTWTATATYATTTGYHNSTNPKTYLNDTIINLGNVTDTVRYTIVPKKNTCTGNNNLYKVAVLPKPKLMNSSLSKSICDSSLTNIILNYNVAGTLFTWTCTSSSPNLSGYFNSTAPDTVVNQRLRNSGYTIDTVLYYIIPHANGCTGDTYLFKVAVDPKPKLSNNPTSKAICNITMTNITLTSNVAGTLFTWNASGSSLQVTGYSANSDPTITLNQMLINSGFNIETVTYHITPHANGCDGPLKDFVVSVYPTPNLSNNPLSKQICNNTSTNLTLTSNVTGTLFTWTCTPSSTSVSGFANSTNPVTQINQTLVNTGFNIETVTYHIIPSANGCFGNSTDFIITVFPVPDLFFVPASQTICPMQSSNITNNSHVSGTTFTWTATGSSLMVTGHSGGSGNLIQQTLNNSGYNIETVTYHVSTSANGCSGFSENVVVTVNPAPFVSLPQCIDPVTTTDAQPIKLRGGTPINGIYQGRGVSNGTLYPLLAGVGMDTIYYIYTNTYGCSQTKNTVILITAPLPFNCDDTLNDLRDNKHYATVLIGTQCWMAANLDYGIRVPGTSHQRDNCSPEKYCYNDNPVNCSSGGALYQWDELMKYDNISASQGLCPPEWHVPSESDWNTLFNYFICNGFAGSPLKYSGYSGFNALLNGVKFKNVSWNFSNFATLFWSSSSQGINKAWAHAMNEYNPSVSFYPASRSNAFSVRCIKD